MSYVSQRLQHFQRLDAVARLYPDRTQLGLERIHRLLTRIGSPHRHLPRTVHVAGTNGKGSTIAMIRAMLEAEHKKVHVYTSPHLRRFHERIVLAGHEIEDDYLAALLERCRKEAPSDIIPFVFQDVGGQTNVDAQHPHTLKDGGYTWFELTTAAAFLAFSEVPADFLLLETGLGGRLDATNVLEDPALTIITSLSLDHTEYLGDTLEKIAYEKAGILKSGCPVITLQHPSKAQEVILNRAAELNCPLLVQGESWQITKTEKDEDEEVEFVWHGKPFVFPRPGLRGAHQIQNAGLALTAGFFLGLDPSSLAQGLRKVSWPGRLQRLSSPEGVELWLDGAHNPGAAEAVLETLLTWQKQDGLPLFMILGMIDGKDHEAFLKVFQNHVQHLFIVPVQNDYHKLDPKVLYDKARNLGFSVTLAESLEESIQQTYNQRRKIPCRVLICGSLYLVGNVLNLKRTN